MSREFIPYKEINIGDQAKIEVEFTEESVLEFSRLIGDDESFHVDEESAAMTVFKKRIVHGIHIAAYISVAVGKKLPGFGTIYCSQSLEFYKPVFLGEKIEVTVKVLAKLPAQRLKIRTIATDIQGKMVMDGVAMVKTYR